MNLCRSWRWEVVGAISACLALSACVPRPLELDDMEEWDFLKDEEARKAEAISGSLTCMVESIRCLSASNQCPVSDACDVGVSSMTVPGERVLNFEAKCVISNRTPYKIDLSYWHIYAWFCERILYANGEHGEAVRMRTLDMGMPNPKDWKYFTIEPMGSGNVAVLFKAADFARLSDRLPEVKWQMQDELHGEVPVWIWTEATKPDHAYYDEESFRCETVFPKVLALEEIGAFPRKWRDPKTGMNWTYTVFRNEVILGSGYHDVRAVSVRTSGELSIPSEIEGLPVVGIGPFAFCCCDRLSVVNVPRSVRSIGYSAFSECDKLKLLNISSNITDMAENAFEKCPDLVIRRY